MKKSVSKIATLVLSLTLLITPTSTTYSEGNLTDTINNFVDTVDKTATTINTVAKSISDMFTDLKAHWAVKYIQSLIDTNIIKGYPDGTFRPDGNITVAEFTKILMLKSNVSLGASGSNWFDQYVNGAKNSGIITAGEYPDYDKPLKRKEAARMISRILGEGSANNLKFNDQDKFGSDLNAIYNVANKGIVKGYPDGTFRPNDNITRAEACAMLDNMNNISKNIPESNVTDAEIWTDKEFIEYMNEIEVYNRWGDTALTHTDLINGILIDKEGNVSFIDNLGFGANYDFEKYDRSKWIKPLSYNLTKRLGYYAKENGNHVHFTNGSGGGDRVQFEYFQTGINTSTAAPCFSVTMTKDIQTHAGKGREYNIGINIGSLANWYDKEGNLLPSDVAKKIKANHFVTDDMVEALRLSMVEVFGEKDGSEFTKKIVDNYKKRNSDESRKTYIDTFEKIKVGKYDIIVSDYVDRTDNTWGNRTYYDFIIK